MLDHYWLKMRANYDTKMTRKELKEFKRCHKIPISESSDSSEQKDDENNDSEKKDEGWESEED